MSDPRACPECLRRAWLLARLAPYIERIATGAPGSRSPELLRLSDEDLAAVAAPGIATQVLAGVREIDERRLGDELRGAQSWACCRHDALYPEGLRDATDAPRALIGRGDPALLAELDPEGTVTVVGARRATSYGREVARELGRELAASGLLVVSGLAFGIDACAHRGALETGRTVAVLGCGADVAYPPAHRSLWRQICEEGLVLSELPPGAGAWRWTFPARNRIMAAVAAMTVVVEGAQRSGSLITADLAADLGRDLGAVPGPVTARTSAGPNELLAGGACLVRNGQDVLDAMLGPGARRVERVGPRLEPWLLGVLEVVEGGVDTPDAVAADLDLSGAEAPPRWPPSRRTATFPAPWWGRIPERFFVPRPASSLASVSSPVPAVLSIAGSDSGGGAGIQADLKAFARCGVHGMTAITAITAQNTQGVSAVEAISAETIVAQVKAVAGDIGVDAVKIGMLGTAETVDAVVEALGLVGEVPIVVDPVMVAESGAVLLDPGAREALVVRLLPLATVVTPNIPEARVLSGAGERDSQEDLAREVLALGPGSVVVTGGHSDAMVDLFFDGRDAVPIEGERHPGGASHGSGCTHSSALAAFLAHGETPLQAARKAREIASVAVGAGLREIGAGAGPVDVFDLSARTDADAGSSR